MAVYVRRGYRVDVPPGFVGAAPPAAVEQDSLRLSGPPGGPLFFGVDHMSAPASAEILLRWRGARMGLPERLVVAGAPREATPFETGYSHAQATGAWVVIPHGEAQIGVFFGHAGPFRTCAEIATHPALAPLLASFELSA